MLKKALLKRLLSVLLAAVAMIFVGCAGDAQEGSDAAVRIKNLRQLAAADNRTERTLMWQADARLDYAVELRRSGSVQRVPAQDSSFADTKDTYIQYTARLARLLPGSRYEYRIVTPKERGAWHELRTDDGRQDFTALIFPDSQSSDYSGWQQLARDAYARNPQAALYISMGDQVDNGEHGYQWQEWFKGVAPFSDKIPLATLLGNHEAYTLDWRVRLPKAYTGLFSYPDNGSGRYQNHFYSFDYGSVHFTVLDTNFKESEKFLPQLWEDELRWLEADLALVRDKWKVVLMHKDIMLYGFGTESGRQQTKTRVIDIGERLMPVFEKYKADVVLSAHLHTYRRRVPLKLSGPAADGIPYIITGVAGSVRYPKLWGDYELDAARAPQPETCNYMTLQTQTDKLILRAFLADGRQFDELVLQK